MVYRQRVGGRGEIGEQCSLHVGCRKVWMMNLSPWILTTSPLFHFYIRTPATSLMVPYCGFLKLSSGTTEFITLITSFTFNSLVSKHKDLLLLSKKERLRNTCNYHLYSFCNAFQILFSEQNYLLQKLLLFVWFSVLSYEVTELAQENHQWINQETNVSNHHIFRISPPSLSPTAPQTQVPSLSICPSLFPEFHRPCTISSSSLLTVPHFQNLLLFK